jgi:two-component system, NtrC family, response regulator HydG
VSRLKNKLKFLIVDDDLDMAESLSDILTALGIHVEIANDGFIAIEKIKTKLFDVVLMDIKMPIMNGVETYKKIKHLLPKAIVVMMTAYAVQDLIAEALREGAYGIWYKPIEIQKIVELIEQTPRKGALILLVDDDLTSCETLADTLQKKGHCLAQVKSGEEAKKIIKEKDFDIVFIDIKMPIMNGLETYLELQKIRPYIKAIMITAYRQEVQNLVEEAIRNNLYTCLYKPIDLNNLLKIIEEILAAKTKTEIKESRTT